MARPKANDRVLEIPGIGHYHWHGCPRLCNGTFAGGAGRAVNGQSADTDIGVVASAKAYLSALNHLQGPWSDNAALARTCCEVRSQKSPFRYQTGSTLVTSQLPVEHWHDSIGDPALADAILDRLIHNAYWLTIDGESMRKKQRLTPSAPSA
uniref:IstB-like ATP-binding domain-containing protein n=1 Tax=Acidithiobacillus sulfuriphilus TaxID=1867749 RepID=A0A3M8RG24_9PROT|nr:hypothetical protein EC580_04295 [Acidithiobacillus sulfuriphilus]